MKIYTRKLPPTTDVCFCCTTGVSRSPPPSFLPPNLTLMCLFHPLLHPPLPPLSLLLHPLPLSPSPLTSQNPEETLRFLESDEYKGKIFFNTWPVHHVPHWYMALVTDTHTQCLLLAVARGRRVWGVIYLMLIIREDLPCVFWTFLEQVTTSPFLYLTLDLPPPPLFQVSTHVAATTISLCVY